MCPVASLIVTVFGRLAWVVPAGLLAFEALAQQPVPYTQVSAGGFKSFAVRADGTLWAWGSNVDGELGLGAPTSAPVLVPQQVALPAGLPPGSGWAQVSAGASHALAIASDGSLWGWGSNGVGELGTGATGPAFAPRPVAVSAPAGTRWAHCAASSSFSLGIRADGTLWQWGQSLLSPSGAWAGTPLPVTAPGAAPGTTWTAVSSRRYHVLALRSDGTLWAWGRNGDGEVGDGTRTDRAQPVAVPVPAGTPAGARWVQAAAGREFSLGLLSTGDLCGWGYNANGVVGPSAAPLQPALLPFPAAAAAGTRWQQVHAGIAHATALRTDGSLWTWGENVYGQLVNNAQTVPFAPVREATNGTWAQVAGGHVHTLAIGTDGGVYAGGAAPAPGTTGNPYNYGQLGNGARTGSLVLQRTLAGPLGRRPAQAAAYHVYPNPARHWLAVDGLPARAVLTLATALGQAVRVETASGRARWDLGNVVAGVYLLTVATEDAAPRTLRVVVE
ncbi:hypothetical protein GCM10011495_39590 [Hymenobacter frigidus]|uniref:T9SS type A sorting domain-containing protein n=1 Tax=Hymenobacter frigidus TaxID=1524095 RepID=A0ABQ2AL53_9BACT|nr:T9SS type A sorting domain-containing protein [Hymenobacter frigidus]GGH91451.1 hypothetical protein GCM10011495_39590 [Hymenobacter frigidus]